MFVEGDTVCLYHVQLPGLYNYSIIIIILSSNFSSRNCRRDKLHLRSCHTQRKTRKSGRKVFNVNFMSSEESDVDGDDAIQIRPLPWRAERVTSFLHSLDRKSNDEKSPQAKRQMKMKQMGNSS